MLLKVKYKADVKSKPVEREFELPWLGFIKHMAICGQGTAPRPQNLFRTLGMFLHYSQYLKRWDFDRNHRFSEPIPEFSDPTEKAQFTTLAARAIADFLSKRIDNCIYTVNYEAAMRARGLPVRGKRPDLLGFRGDEKTISIESKGRMQNVPGPMSKYKRQAKAGKIKANFNVACVTYNLYSEIRCNYFDPENTDVPLDPELLVDLSRDYYGGLLRFVQDEKNFQVSDEVYNRELFLEIRIKPGGGARNLGGIFSPDSFLLEDFIALYNPRLIVPNNLEQLAKEGIQLDRPAFYYDSFVSEPTLEYYKAPPREIGDIMGGSRVYIDNDRVGIALDA